MKIYLTTFSLFLVLNSLCQLPLLNKKKNPSLHFLNVQKLNKLDSVCTALNRVIQICTLFPDQYDFKTYRLYSINADSIISKTISVISGHWKSEALGDNWDLFKTIINPDKALVFTKDEIFFYSKNSLQRHTRYKILLDKYKPIEFQSPLIELEDTKEQWSLYFIQPDESAPWNGKVKKLHLILNKQPGCVCGCPEELYSKNENSHL